MIAGFLGLLLGIVRLLLLIACINLAGMQLARGAARSREMAVRVAIGAGPGRIARQLLTETVVLFVLGGVAGLMLSRWLTALLLAVLPQLPVPIAVDLAADWRVVAFTAGMSLIAALLCGLAPALQARRTSLVPSLKGESLQGGSRLRMRSVFVVGQVTMSLVLVIAAGLFMRTLAQASNAPTGFNHENVDVVSIDLSLARYNAETGRIFSRELLTQMRAIPGVQSASIAVDLPLDGGRMGFGSVTVPGSPATNSNGTHRYRLEHCRTRPVPHARAAAGARARFHRAGHGRGAGRRDRERGVRARSVAGRGSARQAVRKREAGGQDVR